MIRDNELSKRFHESETQTFLLWQKQECLYPILTLVEKKISGYSPGTSYVLSTFLNILFEFIH